jgi:hypothetical protein
MELIYSDVQPTNKFLGKIVFLLTGFLLFAIVVGSSENPSTMNSTPDMDYRAKDSQIIIKIEKKLAEYESTIKR